MKAIRPLLRLMAGARELWGLAGLAALLALGSVVGLMAPDTPDLAALQAQVERLQQRLSGVPPLRQTTAPQGQTAAIAWPGAGDVDRVWPWLQHRLQAQGLQLLSMRPQAVARQGEEPLHEVVLRLQGRWQDWRAVEHALHACAPWWQLDHWLFLPTGAEEIRMDLHVRLGLQAEAAAGTDGAAWPLPLWPQGPAPQAAAVDPFVQTRARQPAQPPDASPSASSMPDDPRQWPVSAVRLQGLWWTRGAAHAVLSAGEAQQVLTVGQPIGREGYRLHTVQADGVLLVSRQPGQPPLHLPLKGERR